MGDHLRHRRFTILRYKKAAKARQKLAFSNQSFVIKSAIEIQLLKAKLSKSLSNTLISLTYMCFKKN